MHILRLPLILSMLIVSLNVSGQRTFEFDYQIDYGQGDPIQYINSIKWRLKELDIKLLAYKVDSSAQRITFEIQTDIKSCSLKPLFALSNKFGFYPIIRRDSLKIMAPDAYNTYFLPNKKLILKNRFLSIEQVGYSDSLFSKKLSNSLILMTLYYRDPETGKHSIHLVDASNLQIANTYFSVISTSRHRVRDGYDLCIKIDESYRNTLSQFSEANIGQPVAMVIDNTIIFAAIIQSELTGEKLCMTVNDKYDAKIFKAILSSPPFSLEIKRIQIAYVLDFGSR